MFDNERYLTRGVNEGNVIKRLRTGIKSDIIKKKHGRKTE